MISGDDVEGDDGEFTESVQDVTYTSSLIGNPYPSALDAIQFIDDNLPAAGGITSRHYSVYGNNGPLIRIIWPIMKEVMDIST